MFKKLILTAAVIALGLTGYASAVDFTWVGANSEEWHDPNNWNIGGALPAAGVDIVFINATESPNFDPNIVVTGAGLQQLYIQNDGVLNILAGVVDVWGLAGNGSAYNNVHDGVLNVWGSYRMAQNLYVGHTDTANSFGVVNIYAGGWLQTNGVLTMAGRRGDAEINIWGTFRQGQGARWNHLARPEEEPYTSVVRIYEGGLWRWTGNHIVNISDFDRLSWIIANGHAVSGVLGYEVVGTFDSTNEWTDIFIQRYLRAYSPVYSPALINNSANTNTVNMSTASGTIDLAWTQPQPSNPAMPIENTFYFGTDSTPVTTLALGSVTDNSKTGVAIEKFKTYYWKVDSYDPNTTVTTTGDIWTFNTENVAPIASAETSPQRIWLVAGAASITLHGTMTDDGYPQPSPTYTYTWAQVDANDILAGPVNTQDVTLNFTTATNTDPTTHKTFRVTCSDDGLATTGPSYDVEVRVFPSACLAGQDATGRTVGDIQTTADCMVNFKDFALMAANWNLCKNYDGLGCP